MNISLFEVKHLKMFPKRSKAVQEKKYHFSKSERNCCRASLSPHPAISRD
jgi:hypothetical protein